MCIRDRYNNNHFLQTRGWALEYKRTNKAHLVTTQKWVIEGALFRHLESLEWFTWPTFSCALSLPFLFCISCCRTSFRWILCSCPEGYFPYCWWHSVFCARFCGIMNDGWPLSLATRDEFTAIRINYSLVVHPHIRHKQPWISVSVAMQTNV